MFLPFANSIRLRLAATLFLGFIVILSLASVFIYFVSRHIFEDDFNARLFAKAQAAVASISQTGTTLDVDWGELPHELNPRKHAQDAIQLVDSSGHPFFTDSPLTAAPMAVAEGGSYRDLDLPPLGHVRVLTLSFLPRVEEEDVAQTPAGLRKNCILEVAGSLTAVDRSLHKLTVILVIMTVATSLSSLVLVWWVVKLGLRPLDRLGGAVARVEAESLGQQLAVEELPEELLPIAGKLNDLLSRLDVSFARERRFSADVSHELRTPVAELRTLSEVMLQDDKLSPDVRQAFEDTRDIAGQMEALVTVLLEMVRQEAGTAPLHLGDLDLGEQVLSVWKKLEEKAARRNIRLQVAPAGKVVIVRAESRLLDMVLTNLLDNAIEYSPEGSVVEATFSPGKDSPCLVISNLAKKLEPSDLSHLFERFWRKEVSRGESHHFGIGLALTKTLCQRLGIHLTVSMEKASIVRFWLHFLTPTTAASS